MTAPQPYFSDDMTQVFLGDCLEVLAGMEAESVDAVVCDPPYALTELPLWAITDALSAWLSGDRAFVPATSAGFMGRDWDKFVPPPAAWDACMRVLKPGGHLLAFAAPRTQDLMGISVRLAGFEIRDGLKWIFGQGYPKSMSVSKAIDKHQRGAMVRAKLLHFATERGIDGAWLEGRGIASASSFTDWTIGGHVPSDRNWQIVKTALEVSDEEEAAFERRVVGQGRAKGTRSTIGPVGVSDGPFSITAAATEDAAEWEGWGTSLKPAHEPVIFARKPLGRTVAENVLAYGTGAVNVAACKVGSQARVNNAGGASSLQRVSRVEHGYRPSVTTSTGEAGEVAGRWPPNVLLSEEAAEEIDRQSGVLTSGANPTRRGSDKFRDAYGEFAGQAECVAQRGTDSGGASRFFPVFRYDAKASADERHRLPDGTAHNTVKPVSLMRWLVRLITPPSVDVLVCSQCGQELRRVWRDVPAEPTRANRLRAEVPTEAGGAGSQKAGDAMPDVRQGAGGRTGEEVLQPGVPGDSTAQAQDMHHLRGGVSGAPADAGDVLAAVRGEGSDAGTQGVREVRRDVSAGFEQEAFLFAGLRGEGDRTGEEEGPDAEPRRLCGPLPAGSPDVEQDGLPAGAPKGDGGRARPHASVVRGGAPQERGQARQPAGEPGGASQAGARQDPQASAQADCVPALRREDRGLGSCPACGGALAAAKRPGLVLDPFAGSGTTGEACIVEGFRSVLVERDPKYAELIMTRLRKPIQPDLFGSAS